MLLSNRPGYVVSSSVHAALLAATLLSFSQTRKFEDAQESVPVEMLTNEQFNEVMKGEKTAKAVKPTPRADKVAAMTETKPLPPVAEAKRDVPTPPPPMKHIADPGEAETPDVPTPPQRTADLTPPEPPKPPAKEASVKPPPLPPVAEKPPVEKPPEDAEAVIPKPPRRPEPPKPEPPKPEPKKPEPQFKPDQLAKLLEQEKQKERPVPKPPEKTAEKPADNPAPKSRPRSGDEAEQEHKFDPADINRLLSKEAPQRKAATGAQLQQVASLGAPNASAAKMSPSMWGALDSLLQDQYKQCWSYIGLAGQTKYVPEIRVLYAQDGTLIGKPALVNPPSDPALHNLADSALRAVQRCNPLRIPAMYQPFYDQWKGRIVRFDPDEMS